MTEQTTTDDSSIDGAASALSAGLERLALLAKRYHTYCEDDWYSCPKAEDGCADDRRGPECDCGADEHNAEVDALMALLRSNVEVKRAPLTKTKQNSAADGASPSTAGLERRTEQCPGGCDHADVEHEAFDDGVGAAERGDHQCPYRGSLREDWLTGHSVGTLNRRSNA